MHNHLSISYFFSLLVSLSWMTELVNADAWAPVPGQVVFDDTLTIFRSKKSPQLSGCELDNVAQPPFNSTGFQPPTTGSSMKYLALGVGYQNYTCNGNESQYIGATAILLDASCIANNTDLLTGLSMTLQNIDPDSAVQAATTLEGFGAAPAAAGTGIVIGRHFTNGLPNVNFDFTPFGHPEVVTATAAQNATAPNTAPPSSVDWLRLNGTGSNITVSLQYLTISLHHGQSN